MSGYLFLFVLGPPLVIAVFVSIWGIPEFVGYQELVDYIRPYSIPLIYLGIFVSLQGRDNSKRRFSDNPTIIILLKDHAFDDSATMRIISFLYSFIKGALLGLVLFGNLIATFYLVSRTPVWGEMIKVPAGSFDPTQGYLFFVISPVLLIVNRLIAEFLVLRLKAQRAQIRFHEAMFDRFGQKP